MNTYWALVQTVPGGFMRVTVQADNPYNAYQMLLGMYGDRLISEHASQVV
jgi:hypothetical protein